MTVKTDIGTTTPDRITVRGKNISTEILGQFDFVDMIWWTTFARMPEQREKNMANLVLVMATDHGLTPSAISARLTYLGAPEALQGAVAAGLLGAGSVFLGSAQNVTEMLVRGAAPLTDEASDAQVRECARALVQEFRDARRPLSGVGHPIHVDGDPRIPTLAAVSRDNGYYGRHWRLMEAIAVVLREDFGRPLPLNAAGGVGAIFAEMGIDPLLARGLGLIGRSAGLVAHILEERESPTGQQIWDLVLAQDPRNALPVRQGERRA
jgi:citrate synthase